MKRPEPFPDRTLPRAFCAWHGNCARNRVRSLSETARIINESGRYDRTLSASDVLDIERKALKKMTRALKEYYEEKPAHPNP